ncbi:hypothetical protein IGB42_03268 [Andreprevotia sp. IGB-42]|uniref:hypothetical protein n=1 Tax=Andreprevotia sp. IGB-42 TaxID=2497473 RepID=UPI0013598CF6|nr:hypothetical protein [Andreprevotia sp. IGB-42]KAF0812278.1 hypothetical protein IGB42_03268 [Andreprevotia sp. IGB-42]
MDELERWQRIGRAGFWRCLLVRGALGWGLPFCLLYGAVPVMLNDPGPYWQHVLAGWPLGLAAGLFYGLGLWGYAQLQLVRARHTKED